MKLFFITAGPGLSAFTVKVHRYMYINSIFISTIVYSSVKLAGMVFK